MNQFVTIIIYQIIRSTYRFYIPTQICSNSNIHERHLFLEMLRDYPFIFSNTRGFHTVVNFGIKQIAHPIFQLHYIYKFVIAKVPCYKVQLSMKLLSRIEWRFKRQKRLYQKVKTVIRRGNLFYGQNACLIAHVYNCEKMHPTQFL